MYTGATDSIDLFLYFCMCLTKVAHTGVIMLYSRKIAGLLMIIVASGF